MKPGWLFRKIPHFIYLLPSIFVYTNITMFLRHCIGSVNFILIHFVFTRNLWIQFNPQFVLWLKATSSIFWSLYRFGVCSLHYVACFKPALPKLVSILWIGLITSRLNLPCYYFTVTILHCWCYRTSALILYRIARLFSKL